MKKKECKYQYFMKLTNAAKSLETLKKTFYITYLFFRISKELPPTIKLSSSYSTKIRTDVERVLGSQSSPFLQTLSVHAIPYFNFYFYICKNASLYELKK